MTVVESERKVVEKEAREVLQRCISDIESGHWICGSLTYFKKDGRNVGPNDKPMGCAIGLVGVNSGSSTIETVGDITKVNLHYPEESPSEWTPAGLLAVKALANTTHVNKEDLVSEDRYSSNQAYHSGVVIETNDAFCETPAVAKEWFERALASIPDDQKEN